MYIGTRSDNLSLSALIRWELQLSHGLQLMLQATIRIVNRQIIVKDATAPVINCNPSVERNTDAGQCAALIEVAAPGASDLCGTVNVIGTRSDNLPLNAAYPLGTTTITWTATDAAGNHSGCDQAIIVKDATAPVITL
jgi:hypothetical protein